MSCAPQANDRSMTPVAMIFLLELHFIAVPVPTGSNARRQAWKDFCDLGLIREGVRLDQDGKVPPGALTDRARAHVSALCSLPLPVAETVWTTPKVTP